ncbi:MAG: UDP-2,3-diacylglucosamine diphosphatase LpxI, partial [Verrucomicrobiia bacterium]
PNHDFRFDIPCVGEKTIESCRAGRVSVMAMEAGRSLLLDKDKLLTAANEAGICLVAVHREGDSPRAVPSE